MTWRPTADWLVKTLTCSAYAILMPATEAVAHLPAKENADV